MVVCDPWAVYLNSEYDLAKQHRTPQFKALVSSRERSPLLPPFHPLVHATLFKIKNGPTVVSGETPGLFEENNATLKQ